MRSVKHCEQRGITPASAPMLSFTEAKKRLDAADTAAPSRRDSGRGAGQWTQTSSVIGGQMSRIPRLMSAKLTTAHLPRSRSRFFSAR